MRRKMLAQLYSPENSENVKKAGYGICLFLLTVGTISMSTSLATIHWFELRFQNQHSFMPGVDVSMGLWKTCSRGKCIIFDDVLDTTPGALKEVRGIGITATVLYGCALIFFLYLGLMGCKIKTKIIQLIFPLTCGAGGIFALATVGLTMRSLKNNLPGSPDDYEYGYSFHLVWTSAVLAIASSLIAIWIQRRFLTNREIATDNVELRQYPRHAMHPPRYSQAVGQTYILSPPPYPGTEPAVQMNNNTVIRNAP